MVECDYLIDDSPTNWRSWKNGRGSDRNFILMNQQWNEKLKLPIGKKYKGTLEYNI